MPPNAYEDLQPTSPEMQALQPANSSGRANAYADFAVPEAKEEKLSAAASPSIGDQLERGAGLTGRALVQGAVGLPGATLDFGHSLYALATDPQARAATWEQMKHPSQWLTPPSDAPTQQFDRALDPYLPTPQTKGEKIASALLSMEGGAATPQVPVPGAGSVPSNFRTTAQVKNDLDAQTLQNSQKAGYVTPPSTTNPSLLNLGLETVAGKINTQNATSAINQSTRNAGAAKDLGLDPGLLTPEAVAAVKSEAGQGFQAARGIPRFNADETYGADLDKVLSQNRGANADFPGASNPDVEKLVETYRQPSFTGNSAVSAVQLLRQKASDAYRNGQSELGSAYKGISAAIERQTERGALSLEQKPDPQQFSLDMSFAQQGDISARHVIDGFGPATHGPNGPMVYNPTTAKWSIAPQTAIKPTQTVQEFGPAQQTGLPFSTRAPESFGPQPQAAATGQYSTLVDALRKARKTYAQASTVEEAMDPSGDVSGRKLAAALSRGDPLSGNILDAAKHAATFPKANGPVNASNVQHLNLMGPLAGAVAGHELTHSPWGYLGGAAMPAARMGSKAYLLSKMGQRGAIPAGQVDRTLPLWAFGAGTGASNP